MFGAIFLIIQSRQDGGGRRKFCMKKGFQKRCDSSLLFMIMVVFIRHKELVFVSAFVVASLE